MRKQTKLVAVLSAAALLAIGASMTSYAAGGWVAEGDNDWVYLDNDGDRVTSEWKRSGDNYYWLNDEGLMAKNALVRDGNDAIYYVNENGLKVMNDWVAIENTENEQVGDDTPSVLYYYFGSAGKAERATEDKKVKQINGKYYIFDSEGHMLSGWQMVNDDLYYLGTEVEGWAYTGWQRLEPKDDLENYEYDQLEWFYFGSNGKASVNKTQYIDKRYYHFDENGVMDDGWYDAADDPDMASRAQAYASGSGTLSSGWILSTAPDDEDDDGDKFWYYLVSLRQGSSIARSIPYNYYGDGAESVGSGQIGWRAKVINNKTYIFNTYGQMITGFVFINNSNSSESLSNKDYCSVTDFINRAGDDGTVDGGSDSFRGKENPYGGIEGRDLVNGLYYFSEDGGSSEGQMQTGRVAITDDGDTNYYYFSKDNKNYGSALYSTIKDGYLYGADGKCVVSEDDNNYAVIPVWGSGDSNTGIITIQGKKVNKDDDVPKRSYGDDYLKAIAPVNKDGNPNYVVVSRTGKIKQSGKVTIDGVRYTISDYVVISSEVID